MRLLGRLLGGSPAGGLRAAGLTRLTVVEEAPCARACVRLPVRVGLPDPPVTTDTEESCCVRVVLVPYTLYLSPRTKQPDGKVGRSVTNDTQKPIDIYH
jgi:hypothetical protein